MREIAIIVIIRSCKTSQNRGKVRPVVDGLRHGSFFAAFSEEAARKSPVRSVVCRSCCRIKSEVHKHISVTMFAREREHPHGEKITVFLIGFDAASTIAIRGQFLAMDCSVPSPKAVKSRGGGVQRRRVQRRRSPEAVKSRGCESQCR